MTLLAELLSTVFERPYRELVANRRDGRSPEALALALVGTNGETSGRALVAEILARFHAMSQDDKRRLFRPAATAMNIDPEAVRSTLDAYENAPPRPPGAPISRPPNRAGGS